MAARALRSLAARGVHGGAAAAAAASGSASAAAAAAAAFAATAWPQRVGDPRLLAVGGRNAGTPLALRVVSLHAFNYARDHLVRRS